MNWSEQKKEAIKRIDALIEKVIRLTLWAQIITRIYEEGGDGE